MLGKAARAASWRLEARLPFWEVRKRWAEANGEQADVECDHGCGVSSFGTLARLGGIQIWDLYELPWPSNRVGGKQVGFGGWWPPAYCTLYPLAGRLGRIGFAERRPLKRSRRGLLGLHYLRQHFPIPLRGGRAVLDGFGAGRIRCVAADVMI